MWPWQRWGRGFLCSYSVWQHPACNREFSEATCSNIKFKVRLTKNAVLKRGESPNGWLAKLSSLLFNSSFLLSRLNLCRVERSY